jgi:hypothetical protein
MMEDAYTVGIRLLLENGVSPGLAVIGQELERADRAVATTRGGMERLRSVAAEAAVASRVVGREAPVAVGPVAVEPPGVAPVAVRPQGLAATAAAMRVEMPAREAAPVVKRQVASVLPVLSRAAPMAAPVMPVKEVRAAGAALPAVGRPAKAVDFAGFAPRVPPATVTQLHLAAPSRGAVEPVAREAGRGWAPPLSAGQVPPDGEASRAVMAPLPPPAPRSVASASAPEAAAAGPAEGGGGGPTGGDVFLDGMRVGRWMARELARQAGGPANGATGFDPRASAVWPGALQGS